MMTTKTELFIRALLLAWLAGGPGAVSLCRAESGTSPADAGITPAFTLRGFGTLGVARSSSEQAEFVRDLAQPGGSAGVWTGKIDSLIGVQGNYRFSDRVEGVAQAVSRYGSRGSYDPELIWAFGKFDPNAHLSLRAGRLGTEFFMLADSRLVGYSYLTVRPPGDYYGTLPFQHIDGADAVVTLPAGRGLLRGKLYAGRLDEKIRFLDGMWNLRGSRMRGGHIDYQAGNWLWRAGYAELRFNDNIPIFETLRQNVALIAPGATAARNRLTIADTTSRFHSMGMVYEDGPLQVQLMLSRTRQDTAIFQDNRAGYLVAGYRLANATPFVGYSKVKSESRQLPGTGVASLDGMLASFLINGHSEQHTSFLGVRWDFRNDMALKVQYDAIRGVATSVFPVLREKKGWNGRTDVLSVTLDFVF